MCWQAQHTTCVSRPMQQSAWRQCDASVAKPCRVQHVHTLPNCLCKISWADHSVATACTRFCCGCCCCTHACECAARLVGPVNACAVCGGDANDVVRRHRRTHAARLHDGKRQGLEGAGLQPRLLLLQQQVVGSAAAAASMSVVGAVAGADEVSCDAC